MFIYLGKVSKFFLNDNSLQGKGKKKGGKNISAMTGILASNSCVWLLGDQYYHSKSKTNKFPFNYSNLDSSSNRFCSFKIFTTSANQRTRKFSPVFSGTLDGAIDPDDSDDEKDEQEVTENEVGGVSFIFCFLFL